MVLEDHPVRVMVGARAVDMGDFGRRLVGGPPPSVLEAPAQIDVLHVHEVPLVPSADGVERGAAKPDRCARDPVDNITGGAQ